MIKIWKGKELEGVDKGVQTMFVSGSTIYCTKIIEFLEQHPDCKRVYLGGGRIDVEEIFDYNKLADYTSKKKIDIVLECSYEGLKTLPRILFDSTDKLIVRMYNELLGLLSSSDQVKVDTGKNVYIVEMGQMIHTDLNDLNKDMFASDVLVYDESEENK